MKKLIVYCFATVILLLGAGTLYCFVPRRVHFQLIKEIEKPCDGFDNTQFVGFHYVESSERLFYWMVEYLSSRSRPEFQGYDSLYVNNLSRELDFVQYDYIIAYQKKLKSLSYSPYLTRKIDGIYFDKKTPLIPTWDSQVTDMIYIYQIKKNNRLRSFGP